jgi:hypothetical protein
MISLSDPKSRSFTGGALLAVVALMCAASQTRANVLVQYQANADPVAEGFSALSCCGSGSTGSPLSNDQGLPAWSIGGGTLGSQYGYLSGGLTSTQQAAIATNGFVLTIVDRVIQGTAPAYTTIAPVTIAGADLDTGVVRWEIDLGLDASGNTVVVLPTTVNAGGPGGAIEEPGASDTLTVAGNGYNTYQLIEAPGASTASLFVNGVEEFSGYTGETAFVLDRGLEFSAFSGGQGNFNLVSVGTDVSSVPEPASLSLLGVGLAGIAALRRRVSHRVA